MKKKLLLLASLALVPTVSFGFDADDEYDPHKVEFSTGENKSFILWVDGQEADARIYAQCGSERVPLAQWDVLKNDPESYLVWDNMLCAFNAYFWNAFLMDEELLKKHNFDNDSARDFRSKYGTPAYKFGPNNRENFDNLVRIQDNAKNKCKERVSGMHTEYLKLQAEARASSLKQKKIGIVAAIIAAASAVYYYFNHVKKQEQQEDSNNVEA